MSNGWPYGDSDPQGPDGWVPRDEPFPYPSPTAHSAAVTQWPAGEPGPDGYRYESRQPAADAGGDPWTAGQDFAGPWASEGELGGPRAPGYGQWTPPGPPVGGRPILAGPPRAAVVDSGPEVPARERASRRDAGDDRHQRAGDRHNGDRHSDGRHGGDRGRSRGRGQAGREPEQVPDADYEWFRYLGEGRPGRPDSNPGDQGFAGDASQAGRSGYDSQGYGGSGIGGSAFGGGQSGGDWPARPGAGAPAGYLDRGGFPGERPERAAPPDGTGWAGRSRGPAGYPYPSGSAGEFPGRSSGWPGDFPGSLAGQSGEPGEYPDGLPGRDPDSYARPPYPAADDSGPLGGYRRGVMDSAEYASPLYPPPGAAVPDPGPGRDARRGDGDGGRRGGRGGRGAGRTERSGDGYWPSRPSGPSGPAVASRPAAWAGPLAESGYDPRPTGRPGPSGGLDLATRPGEDSGQFAIGVAPADTGPLTDSAPLTDSGPIAAGAPLADSGPMAAVAPPRRRGERDDRDRPRRHGSRRGAGQHPDDERAAEVAGRPGSVPAEPSERRRPGRRADEAAGENRPGTGRGSAGRPAASARQGAAAPDLAPGPAKSDPTGRPGKFGRRGKSGRASRTGKGSSPAKASAPAKASTSAKASAPAKASTSGKVSTSGKSSAPAKASAPVKNSAPVKASAPVRNSAPVKTGAADGGADSAAARRGASQKRAKSGRHLTFGLFRIPLRAVIVSGSAMVTVLAVAAYLLLLAPQPAHSITAPARLGRYVRQSSVASGTARQLRSKIVAGARGEVKNVVGAVYEQLTGPGTSTGPQIVVFIGGNLTGNGSAGGFISGFKSELRGSFSTSAGRLGGQAACAPASQGRLAECAWADNDTFGVVVSATLHARALAAEMRQMRPLIEHRIR